MDFFSIYFFFIFYFYFFYKQATKSRRVQEQFLEYDGLEMLMVWLTEFRDYEAVLIGVCPVLFILFYL